MGISKWLSGSPLGYAQLTPLPMIFEPTVSMTFRTIPPQHRERATIIARTLAGGPRLNFHKRLGGRVPHPIVTLLLGAPSFDFFYFSIEGWESTNINRPFVC
jgi:hypothetical protein